MKVKIKDIYVLLCVFLICTGSGNTILDAWQDNAIIVLILASVFLGSKNISRMRLTGAQRVFICFIIVAVASYFYAISRSNVIKYSVILITVLLATFYTPNVDMIKKVIYYVKRVTFIDALSIIVFKIMGTTVVNVLSFYFTTDAAMTAALNNQSAGLSGHVAYAAYMCVIGGSLLVLDYATNTVKNREFFLKFSIYFFALMFTGKRMMTLILISIIIVIIVLVKAKGKRKKIFIATFLLLSTLLLVYNIRPELFVSLNRLFLSTTDDYTTLNSRTLFWGGAISLFKQHPILGIGYHNYPIYDASSTVYGLGRGWDAHNMYLQVLAELGIIGGSLLFLSYILALIKTMKLIYLFKKKREIMYYEIALVAIILQLIYLIYGITGYPIYYYSYLFAFFFSIMICKSAEMEAFKMGGCHGNI